MTLSRALLLCISATLATACGSQGTHPDDMSAEEHRQTAGEEELDADRHDADYDPNAHATVAGGGSLMAISELYGLETYNPTAQHHAEAQRLRELAEEHRAAAATLERFEEQECGRFPAQTRPICPLLNQVREVTDIDGGVSMRLVDGANAAAVRDHSRCHVAFARTHGREGMDHCPLYLQGVSVGSGDGGVTLVSDQGEAAVTELRRLARAHMAD